MRRLLVILILCLLLVTISSCDRYIESKDPVRSLPQKLAAPINLEVQVNNRSVTLSWELLDSSGVMEFRIYRALSQDSVFTAVDSTSSFSKEITGLPLNQEIRFQVAGVNSRGIEGARSQTVSAIVSLLSISIADNAAYTNTLNVQVRLNAPSTATYVILSEDSLFQDGAKEQPFLSNLPFTLSQGDGEKMVFAHFYFSNGSESGSPVFDDIILDTRTYIDSVFYSPTGTTFTTGDTITFFIDADNETGGEASVSFGDVNRFRLYDDGAAADVTAGDGIYTGCYVVPVGLTVNNTSVTGHFTDAAGNEAAAAQSAVSLNILNEPAPVQLTSVEALSNFEVSLLWTESVSGDFSVYRVYRDVTDAVADTSELITSISSYWTTSYVDTTVQDNTAYYYCVYVMDNSGLSAGSNVDSAVTPENVPPTPVTVAAGFSDSTMVRLTWTNNDDRDFESYRIYRDDTAPISLSDELIAIVTEQSTVTYDDYVYFVVGSDTTEAYYYRVFVFDRQGLSASSTNEVSVSPWGP